MKKTLMAVFAVALVAVAGSAMAADTNTLTVSANVVGTCKFSSATSTLTFPPLDPSSGGDVNGTTTVQFWCTKGVTTESFSAGQGMHYSGSKNQMQDPASTDTIPYTLSFSKDGNSNAGPGAPRTLTINGQVLGTDYTAKTAGSYSDTVTVTLTN